MSEALTLWGPITHPSRNTLQTSAGARLPNAGFPLAFLGDPAPAGSGMRLTWQAWLSLGASVPFGPLHRAAGSSGQPWLSLGPGRTHESWLALGSRDPGAAG